MKTPWFIALAMAVVPVWIPAANAGDTRADSAKYPHWPQFRGRFAKGVADGWPLPTNWDATAGTNIKWKTPIPGLGHSSPIVWGDKVFVTTSISGKSDDELRVGLYGDINSVDDNSPHKWVVYCLNKKSGSIVWQQTAHAGVPAIKRHPKSTHANSTPATDGKHVVAFFGSEGLFCYDFSGELLWKKDLGTLDAGYWVVPKAQWEFGSSPIIYDGKVIVQCDIQKDPFIAAYDVNTGAQLWRKVRDEVCTWSTPTVHKSKDRTQVITNGFRHIGGYDVDTGNELWKFAGGADIPVPTPFVAGDLIYITSSHQGPIPLYAIKMNATGELTLADGRTSSEYIAWFKPRRGVYMQTPIVYQDMLFTCTDNGILTCYNPVTGDQLFRDRITRGVGNTASPVAGDGKLYFSAESGEINVLKAAGERVFLAVNPMGETVMATPAISEGNILIRGRHHLFCIGE